MRDELDELQDLELAIGEKRFMVHTPAIGDAGKSVQAVGVSPGPSVRLQR